MTPRSFSCRAIVFDLDGVLADSTQAVNRSWETWSERHGIDPQRAIRIGHGRTTLDAVRELAPELDANESCAEMEALEESHLDSVVPVSGAREFVLSVAALGMPWGVATSGTRRIALPRLERCGIPPPPVLITADDVARGKPDPEPYAKAAAALGVPPGDCVVFEDAPNGVRSARSAGAIPIAVGMDAGEGADAAIADFRGAHVAADGTLCYKVTV